MKIKDYYPSNILKRCRGAMKLQRSLLLNMYFVTHPSERDSYYLILHYFNWDEEKVRDYIKEYGLVDPKFIMEQRSVVQTLEPTDENFRDIIEVKKNK